MNKVEIKIDGKTVGHAALSAENRCMFQYSDEWLSGGYSISPIELPLERRVFTARRSPFDGNFGVFDDCLPDGWGRLILTRWLQTKGIDINALSLLDIFCLVGTKGRGAIEFHPDNSFKESKEYVDFEKLAIEAEQILDDNPDTSESLEEFVERGGSPGGARPKIFIKDNEGEWLVKFKAKYDPSDIGKREFKYSELAKRCGLRMMPCKLFEDKYFGTKRFDRQKGERQHIVSAAGLLCADFREPSLDYLALLQLTYHLTKSMEEMWQMFRLMAFNYLIGNKDDHAKNFAFIHDGEWHMAPAYDLLPSSGFHGFHTTTINDKSVPQKEDLIIVAEKAGLDRKQAISIYEDMERIIRR